MATPGKPLFLALIFLLIAVAGYLVWQSAAVAVVPAPVVDVPAAEPGALAVEAVEADSPRAATGAGRREVAAEPPPVGDAAADPEVLAALASIVGRVVQHDGEPVPDSAVKLFRFDPSIAFLPGRDVMATEIAAFPDLEAGETVTGSDGRFQITGLWPRAFYLLKADAVGDNPTLQILPRTPSPGEEVDVGDVVLKNGGVLTGVVMAGGEPLAGALVRAADLPGFMTQFVPVEQFDPAGYVISVESDNRMVIRMPAFAKRYFEELPIPSCRSDVEGRFRLTGVEPGVNLVAVTADGYRSNVQQNVKVDPGEERDLGQLRLDEGEIAGGRVVDTAGKRVADAEVIIANKLTMIPVAFAKAPVRTDESGEFEVEGMANGDVVAAARRRPGDPWVVIDPQPIAKDVVVTLPGRHAVTVRLTSEPGLEVAAPRFRLLAANVGDERNTGGSELASMAMFGLVPAVELDGRVTELEDGRFRIDDLGAGRYLLLATAPNHAVAARQIELTSDVEVAVSLPRQRAFDVVVVDGDNQPIRGAAIYGEPRGAKENRVHEAPVHCGRTDVEGKLRVTALSADEVHLSASHPRYGQVGAKVTLPASAPVVMQLREPGSVSGTVTSSGKPPEPGKYMVVANLSWSQDRVRGPLGEMPAMTVPDLEGRFELRGLQPGTYRVEVIKSFAAIKSFGNISQMMMSAWMGAELPEREVVVVSGQSVEVSLDTDEKPVVEGPSANVSGTVFVDGQPASGMSVVAWGGRRTSATVDAGGRFDLGQLREGNCHVQLMDLQGDRMEPNRFGSELWQTSLELKGGEDRHLAIELTMSSLSGLVVTADGQPAPRTRVRASGLLAGRPEDAKRPASANMWSISAADGTFAFERLPAGRYSLEAESNELGKGFAQVEVQPGLGVSGLRIELARTYKVSGKIDRSVFEGLDADDWMWISLDRRDARTEARDGYIVVSGSEGAGVDDNGGFTVDNVLPGRYGMSFHGSFTGRYEWKQEIVVSNRDVSGLEVRPIRIKEDPKPVNAGEAKGR